MRIGFNPNKDATLDGNNFSHQVIVPVYIPSLEGYFKDSFGILKLCLTSLFATCHSQTYFTVADNGSCMEVAHYLDQLREEGQLHEVIHTPNIGKLNAVLKSLTGGNFPLITVTDADVLFLDGWQAETYEVFANFPKTGAVCPTPSSKSFKTHTANIWFDLFFSKRLRFTPVKNPEALKMFAASIDNKAFYNDHHLNKYLTVANGNYKAVVGAGHFVTTYRGSVFSDLSARYSDYKLGGTSESSLLDIPVVKKGLWRLSTADNFAYHLGNVEEPWMMDTVNNLNQENKKVEGQPLRKTTNSSSFSYFLKNKIFGKLFSKKSVVVLLLQFKGLTREAAKKYV